MSTRLAGVGKLWVVFAGRLGGQKNSAAWAAGFAGRAVVAPCASMAGDKLLRAQPGHHEGPRATGRGLSVGGVQKQRAQ
eukprot:scaffold9373_cov107-Isochrysis_galbana.AAC.5